MNVDLVHRVLDTTDHFNEDCDPSHTIRWENDGHSLRFAVSLDGAAKRIGACQVCKRTTREGLLNDYMCLECRVSRGLLDDWSEIEAHVDVQCPHSYERREMVEQRMDGAWTPPPCVGGSQCLVRFEIDYEGADATCGHPMQRLSLPKLDVPLLTFIPILYSLEVHHYPGEYGGQGESDVEFGWIPKPENKDQLILADCNQAR